MAIPESVRREVHLLPSILSADFARLGDQVREVMDAGATVIHVDVMDGHFVPNITVGPLVVKALAPEVHGRGGFFSVHLMIERPEAYVSDFVAAGADAIAIHAEACSDGYRTLESIRSLGASPGLALNPGTDVSRIEDLKSLIDHVVVMTVNPGFGGQELIAPALAKISELRCMLPETTAIAVDGGVKRDNIRGIVELGGNWVIAGSVVFGAADAGSEARALQRLMAGKPPV